MNAPRGNAFLFARLRVWTPSALTQPSHSPHPQLLPTAVKQPWRWIEQAAAWTFGPGRAIPAPSRVARACVSRSWPDGTARLSEPPCTPNPALCAVHLYCWCVLACVPVGVCVCVCGVAAVRYGRASRRLRLTLGQLGRLGRAGAVPNQTRQPTDRGRRQRPVGVRRAGARAGDLRVVGQCSDGDPEDAPEFASSLLQRQVGIPFADGRSAIGCGCGGSPSF